MGMLMRSLTSPGGIIGAHIDCGRQYNCRQVVYIQPFRVVKITVTKRLLKSGRYQIGDDRFLGWSWRKKKKACCYSRLSGFRADDGIRTHDINLGKVALYH